LATWSDSNFPPRLVLTRFPTFEIAESIKKDGGFCWRMRYTRIEIEEILKSQPRKI
jgi:hypothetical protein